MKEGGREGSSFRRMSEGKDSRLMSVCSGARGDEDRGGGPCLERVAQF